MPTQTTSELLQQLGLHLEFPPQSAQPHGTGTGVATVDAAGEIGLAAVLCHTDSSALEWLVEPCGHAALAAILGNRGFTEHFHFLQA
jgi:hypothetical protein